VLAGAAGGCLVPLLAKDHVFGGEPANLDKELPGRAALIASIEQAAIRATPALSTAGRWSDIFLSTLFNSPVFASTTFWSIPMRVRDILVVLCPHDLISFSGFLDETSET